MNGVRLCGGFKCQLHIAGCFAHYVEGCTFTFGNLLNAFYIIFRQQQAHPFLTFVADNFFCTECRITYGQFVHFNHSTGSFDKLREAVEMASGSVIMNGNNRVTIRFGKGTYYVCNTFLHFGIGALHCIQFNGIGVPAGFDRRNSTTTHTDSVVVATHHHHFFSGSRFTLECITARSITHTSSKHDYLVVSVCFVVFLMFECKQRTADERLPEFISEIGSAVRGFNQYLFGSLIEPFSFFQCFFPGLRSVAGIGSHVHCCTCYRQAGFSTTQPVADFTARSGSCTVEWLHGGGEVMRLGFEGNY